MAQASTAIKAQIELVIEHIRNNCLDYSPLVANDYKLLGLWVLAEAGEYSLWLGERKIGTINLGQLAQLAQC